MKDKIAKKILKMEKDKLMLEPETDRDWVLITALDIAIEALEREVDLEQAVVNIKMSDEEIKQFKQMLQEHTFIEGASFKDSQSNWIPVSERLPNESNGSILITTREGKVTMGKHSEYSGNWYIGDMAKLANRPPVAWMPLPESYKEIEND